MGNCQVGVPETAGLDGADKMMFDSGWLKNECSCPLVWLLHDHPWTKFFQVHEKYL